jgi:hypothetical protein
MQLMHTASRPPSYPGPGRARPGPWLLSAVVGPAPMEPLFKFQVSPAVRDSEVPVPVIFNSKKMTGDDVTAISDQPGPGQGSVIASGKGY